VTSVRADRVGRLWGRGGAFPREEQLYDDMRGSVSIDALSRRCSSVACSNASAAPAADRARLAWDSPIPARLPAVASDYVVEKLVVAVESLAVSTAPIQQRLGNAWMDALVHLRPDDFDDPRERALFSSISDAVTAKGGVLATTDSMSDGQALAPAGELVELLRTISLKLAVQREPPTPTD
jgi:hypothetical protein